MKTFFAILLMIIGLGGLSGFKPLNNSSPLGGYSKDWNDPVYAKANTASGVNYMSAREKQVIYILNLVRTNPKLFARTVLEKYPTMSNAPEMRNSDYYKSLMQTLNRMEPLGLLAPGYENYLSAECHAETSGKTGYTGHSRKGNCSEKQYYMGESCDYGHEEPLDIVLSLLIDEGIASLGHRKICFTNYKTLGVSIQPHTRYRVNAVLDFYY